MPHIRRPNLEDPTIEALRCAIQQEDIIFERLTLHKSLLFRLITYFSSPPPHPFPNPHNITEPSLSLSRSSSLPTHNSNASPTTHLDPPSFGETLGNQFRNLTNNYFLSVLYSGWLHSRSTNIPCVCWKYKTNDTPQPSSHTLPPNTIQNYLLQFATQHNLSTGVYRWQNNQERYNWLHMLERFIYSYIPPSVNPDLNSLLVLKRVLRIYSVSCFSSAIADGYANVFVLAAIDPYTYGLRALITATLEVSSVMAFSISLPSRTTESHHGTSIKILIATYVIFLLLTLPHNLSKQPWTTKLYFMSVLHHRKNVVGIFFIFMDMIANQLLIFFVPLLTALALVRIADPFDVFLTLVAPFFLVTLSKDALPIFASLTEVEKIQENSAKFIYDVLEDCNSYCEAPYWKHLRHVCIFELGMGIFVWFITISVLVINFVV
jgi:hypothetical protein